eukprot:PhF_6_TR8505/c0_g1_i1/m.13306/K07897/RAB7A; Ras-related protein Rab-7A
MSSSKPPPPVQHLKLIVLGSPKVGKTSIIHRYTNYRHHNNFGRPMSIPIDFYTKRVPLRDGILGVIQIWDSTHWVQKNGCEFIMKNIDGCVVVYDAGNDDDSDVTQWRTLLDNRLDKSIPLVLFGNKADLLPPHARENLVQSYGDIEKEKRKGKLRNQIIMCMYVLNVDPWGDNTEGASHAMSSFVPYDCLEDLNDLLGYGSREDAYFIVSAKEDTQITEGFEHIIDLAYQRKLREVGDIKRKMVSYSSLLSRCVNNRQRVIAGMFFILVTCAALVL